MSRILDSDVAGEPELVEVVTTFLEMRQRPHDAVPLAARADISGIIRADPPSVSFYRYLYDTVGAPWHWYERRQMRDAALRAIIENAGVEVYVAYVRGSPAGYVELDRRIANEVELAYFGLMPECIGRGLGPWLLNWGLRRAWSVDASRVWLHTCTLDHPSALAMYQRAGFKVYDRQSEMLDMARIR